MKRALVAGMVLLPILAGAQTYGTAPGQIPGGWDMTGYSRYTQASDTSAPVFVDSTAWAYSGGRRARVTPGLVDPFQIAWKPSRVREWHLPATQLPLLSAVQADSQSYWTGTPNALRKSAWSNVQFDAQGRMAGGAWGTMAM